MNANIAYRAHRWLILVLALAGPASTAAPQPTALWTIGKPDGAAMEFAPGSRSELTFTVGQSVVSKDFAGNQSGSVGWDGKSKETRYAFCLTSPKLPAGNMSLCWT
jgi:hypothetical protein